VRLEDFGRLLGAATTRRAFLGKTALTLAPAVVGHTWTKKPPATDPPTSGQPAVYIPPTRTRGASVRNVRDYGALGDGAHDDTAAFQAAINSLPSDGGTVNVPAGRYLLDAVRSIRLRSRMLLQLAPDATLVVKPNAADKAYLIYALSVNDVEIAGGQVIGDRYGHLGTTGEWGHAVFVRGCNRVTVRDMRLADCWGDGISIGAALVYGGDPIPSGDVVVANVVSTNNRRQGISIGRANNVVLRDSEFSNSNGTAPECGIDIEPDDPGIANVVSIENCAFRGNRKYGMLCYKRSQNTTIRRCTVENNGSCGIVTVGTTSITIESNDIRLNRATGIYLQDGTSNCQISQNSFYGNYSSQGVVDRTDFTLDGWASKIERDILVRGITSDIRILTNYYK
jgi:parallel beta-helix repeat protein